MDDAHQAIEQIAAGQRGRLRLAVAPSVAMAWIPSVLPPLLSDQIEVEVSEGTAKQVFEAVQVGEADLGIQGRIEGFPELVCYPALNDEYVRVGNGDQRIGLTLDTSIEQQLSTSQLPAPVVRVANPALALKLVDEIDGYAILPRLTVGDRMAQPYPQISRQLNWIGRPGFQNDPMVRRFIAGVQTNFYGVVAPE